MCAIVSGVACAIVCVRASEYARCAGSTTLAIPSCLYNLPCLPVRTHTTAAAFACSALPSPPLPLRTPS